MKENFSNSISYKPQFNQYLDPVLDYICSPNNLDFGCGTGGLSRYLAGEKPDVRITAFDSNPEKIKHTNHFTRFNLKFTDSLEGVKDNFSSATGIFVFHEVGEEIFPTINKFLHPGSFFSVIDYQLKGIDKDYFIEKFSSSMEMTELTEIGVDSAYQIHTRYNLSDCINMSQKNGFKTIFNQTINNNKYFIWVGKN